MAIASQIILEKLYKEGRVSFSEEDLENQTSSVKRVLYSFGAYKGIPMSEDYQYYFGIRELKKLIDNGMDINKVSFEELMYIVYSEELKNIEYIFQISMKSFLRNLLNSPKRWKLKDVFKNIKTWKKIKRGKDLRLPDFGKIDVTKAFEDYRSIVEHSQAYIEEEYTFPSVNNIRIVGYFKEQVIEDTIFQLERYSKKLTKRTIPLFLWMKKNSFPFSRYDELQDAIILDFFDYSYNLKTTLKMLDDIVERDLKLLWSDKIDFEYKNTKKVIEKISKIGLTFPKNGIDLKRQGRRFKNCAGGYVNKIRENKTLIAYNNSMMVELSLNGKTIRQAYTIANKPVTKIEDLKILNKIKNLKEENYV